MDSIKKFNAFAILKANGFPAKEVAQSLLKETTIKIVSEGRAKEVKLSESEIQAFLNEYNPEDTTNIFDPKNPNKHLGIQFDYFKLSEKREFEAYLEFLESLSPSIGHSYGTDQMFDFELHEMIPILEERYPGIPGSPIDHTGLRFRHKEPKPINSTRITMIRVRDFNQQILNAHSVAGYGKYYLLKKPVLVTDKKGK